MNKITLGSLALIPLTALPGCYVQTPAYMPHEAPRADAASAPRTYSQATKTTEVTTDVTKETTTKTTTTAPNLGRLPDPPETRAASIGDRTENYEAFVDAYRRSGRPRLAIFTDIESAAGGTSKTLNDKGTVARFGPRLEAYFRGPDVTIINGDAMALATRQQVEALARNDESAAARMLGDALKADVVLLVKMLEQPPNRNDGAEYAASYVLADLRRGTTIGSWSFDMTRDAEDREFTSRRMSEYARAIARRSMSEFVSSTGGTEGAVIPGGRAFTIRVIGNYQDDDLSAFRGALAGMPGVAPNSVMLRAEDKSRSRAMSTFELTYAGDLLDLRRVARRAAVDQLGMEADIVDSREGTIDLRLAPLALTERERLLTGGAETPRNIAARQQLRDAYEKAGKPTIAVMINRAAVESDAPLAPDANASALPAATTAIVIGDRVNLGAGNTFGDRIIDRELSDRRTERREDAVIDTRAFEDQILRRLLQLGLIPKDISAAQADAFKDNGFDAKKQDDRSLAYTLGKKASADVVISGVGRLVRSRGDATPLRVVFTMRAYKVADGTILGATSVQRDITGEQSINQAIEELSAEAVGKLAATMTDAWRR